MKHLISFLVGSAALVLASAGHAANPEATAPKQAPSAPDTASSDAEAETPIYQRGGLAGVGVTVGGKLGFGLSQPFNDALGASPVGELELGYVLPPLDRSIQLFLSGQYAAPGGEEKDIEDPEGRLPGLMSYEITQQQAIISLGALYRVPLPTPMFRPYGGLGARMYLLRTVINGSSAGEQFGENEETATGFGVLGVLGGEAYVGPGALLLELQIAHVPVDGFVLRNASSGALNVALGYRMFI